MKRPGVPEDIHQTVKQKSRSYEKSWWQTLERILEQEAEIEIIETEEVEA